MRSAHKTQSKYHPLGPNSGPQVRLQVALLSEAKRDQDRVQYAKKEGNVEPITPTLSLSSSISRTKQVKESPSKLTLKLGELLDKADHISRSSFGPAPSGQDQPIY